ncbi:MAG TPA: hypothetical protein VHV08_14800 [Pirellulales bacterium]|jgi:hypothetical protein|nr:hypothetical protein [Pirellulales bacterium]
MDQLLLYDPTLRESAPLIGDIWKVGIKDQKSAGSLEEMARHIGRSQFLDLLVIYMHGFAGGIMIGGQGYNLSDQAIADAMAKTKTHIVEIRFEGCWVGEGPPDMVAFGQMFDSVTVSAFNWVHWSSKYSLTIPKGTDAVDLQKLMKPVERWLAPGAPPFAQLASMARNGAVNKTLLLEWFQYDLIAHAPYDGDNLKQLGSHSFKTRSQATQTAVEAKDAEFSLSPRPSFQYVTVKLRAGDLRDI